MTHGNRTLWEEDGLTKTITLDDHGLMWIMRSERGKCLRMSIPMIPLSQNSLSFRDKRGRLNGWAKLAAEKTKWRWEIELLKAAIGAAFYNAETMKCVKFTVYWPPGNKRGKDKWSGHAQYTHYQRAFYRTRLPDKGNLVAGLKPALDCLKICGFIKEDNPKWLREEYDVRKSIEWLNDDWPHDLPVPGWTEIEVYDI